MQGTQGLHGEQLAVAQLGTFPAFYGTSRFITAFATPSVCHNAESDSHFFTRVRFTIILPSMHSFPSRLFPSGFATKLLYAVLIPCMLTTRPAHLVVDVTVLQVCPVASLLSGAKSPCSQIRPELRSFWHSYVMERSDGGGGTVGSPACSACRLTQHP